MSSDDRRAGPSRGRAHRAVGAFVLLVMLAALTTTPARAEPPACATEMDDEEVTERLAWIDARLRAGQPGAATYWGGWLAYAAVEGGVGFAELARARNRLDRDVWLVTGVGAVLWVGEMLIFPMRPAYAPRRLRTLPRGTPEERRIALGLAERLLERAAHTERDGLSWESHALGLAWALGSSAYIFGRSWNRQGNGNDRANDHVLSVTALEFVATVLITEAAILTTPRKAMHDARTYRASRCGAPPPLAERARPQLFVGASPLAVSLTLRF